MIGIPHRHVASLLALALAHGISPGAGSCQIVVRGQVLDANSRRAVPYVSVMLADRPVGVSADAAGRFVLTVPDSAAVVLFRHINYEEQALAAGALLRRPQVFLQPRVIPLPAVLVEAPRERLAASSDLPLSASHIQRQHFDLRGFVDAGDLLQVAPSVQVNEVLSGRKTISIRGGNADDVAVLFHGIRLNSAFDNIFDLSLVDLADVEQVELIRGSNAVLHGGGAFSGVINLVPRLEEAHTVRFFQRVGTYDAGTWGLSAYGQGDKGQVAGMYRQSGATRYVEGRFAPHERLENRARSFTLHGKYAFGASPNTVERNELSALYLHGQSEYDNLRLEEAFAQSNELLAGHYGGALGALQGLDLTLAHHRMRQHQELREVASWLVRGVNDRTLYLELQKAVRLPSGEGLVAYQRTQDWLDFVDRREPASMEEAAMVRTHHAAVGLTRFRLPSGSARLGAVELDFALRHDRVTDRWRKAKVGEALALGTDARTTLRCGMRFTGAHGQFLYDVFMNVGSNMRFPSLAQLISARRLEGSNQRLLPEYNRSVELAGKVARELGPGLVVHGWEVEAGFFKSDYAHKLREYVSVGIPLSLYDTVPSARIAGFEGRAAAFLLRKKLTVEGCASRFFVNEHAAFPFHAEAMGHVAMELQHAGYALRVVWFAEGASEGWVRDGTGGLAQVLLEGRSDMDLHVQKTWQVWRVRLAASLSVRNMRNERTVLYGLALRDRRYYLTGAVEY
ncbi:MAG: TonB-dependent receptor [candidate division KSB1 bacterium]|nr:TonB-dependent receptor [candidate division KSB1 bacterium]